MAGRNKGNIFLLLAALVWGMGLVSQQAGMEHLGPDGGFRGGQIVAQGTPEEVAQVEGSYTGEFLRKILKRSK